MPSKKACAEMDEYHDRAFTDALVRKGNKIGKVSYYSLHGRVYVKNGKTDMTIVEASTGQGQMSSAEKLSFIASDPDLERNGAAWTCGGCRKTRYCGFTRHSTLYNWLQHKVRCPTIQKRLQKELEENTNVVAQVNGDIRRGRKRAFGDNVNAAPPALVIGIGSKKSRKIAFEEDESGVIREVFDNGDCVAVEAKRAAAKRNKLFDHPLLIISS